MTKHNIKFACWEESDVPEVQLQRHFLISNPWSTGTLSCELGAGWVVETLRTWIGLSEPKCGKPVSQGIKGPIAEGEHSRGARQGDSVEAWSREQAWEGAENLRTTLLKTPRSDTQIITGSL